MTRRVLHDGDSRTVPVTGWLIPFTDDELEAIYAALEQFATEDMRLDAALDCVIDKIISVEVGNPRPTGAIGRLA